MAQLRSFTSAMRAARLGLVAFGLGVLVHGTARAGDEEASAGVVLPPTELERVEGHPVRRIDVVGSRRITKDDVLAYLRTRAGEVIKTGQLGTDVRALWDSGFFDDVRIEASLRDEGVDLRFVVHERPTIKSISFKGNDEIENDKLKEMLELKEGSVMSVPAAQRCLKKIRDAYAEKGYYLAQSSYSTEALADDEVSLAFQVVENAQVTVRRIHFIGNAAIASSELRGSMLTAQKSLFGFGSGAAFRQDMFEHDAMMITALYYDRGYLGVQVATPRAELSPDREGVELTVSIDEGARYRVRQLKLYEVDESGREVEPLGGRKALRSLVRTTSGDYFNRADLLKDLQLIRSKYRDAGFANVEAEPQTSVDASTNEVDVFLPIRRHEAVRIGRIEVRGNGKTRDKVIRRELEIEEGQLFSESGMDVSKRRVQALGYFDRVDFSTESGRDKSVVDIVIDVGERSTGTFQVGAGFSSLESFIATAQIQQANLLGNGQSLSVQAQISSLRQLVNIRLFEPYFLDTTWSLSTELYDQIFVFPNFTRRSTGGSLTLGQAIVQPWLRVGLTGTLQWDAISQPTSSGFLGSPYGALGGSLPIANLFNAGRTVSLRPAITYDTRDNRLFPTNGAYAQISSELASDFLGSELLFMRHRWTGRLYYNLGGATGQPGSGFVLKANTEAGLITSPTDAGVPIFNRFYLGGILDVRGYRLRTVGPRLPLSVALDPNSAVYPTGTNIGGNLQAYSNFEFEFPILDKVGIRGVTFFDIGNAWNTEAQYCKTTPAPQFSKEINPCFDAASLLAPRMSTGFGVRWFSPLGPLRFEWGYPLTRMPWEESYVFEFTIGNFF
jgi:outer membrane protein insertion porin family